MSLTNSKLSVETISPEGNVTYYVTLQAANTGKSAVDYVSPLLTYNTGLGNFFVNNRVVPTSNVISLGSSVSSPNPPTDPKVGDLWYDTIADIQFEYVSDGINRQWIDITGPTMSIGGQVNTNTITYVPFSATANPITTRNLNSGDSVGFSTFTSVSGGYPYAPYTYYIASGTLPTGLTLNSSTGIVSGFAGRASTATNVVFGVRDATNNSVTTTVTFNITVTIQFLVVAGGGGGGADRGAGGGAGGLLTSTLTTNTSSIPISISVGVGGAAGGPGAQSSNGVNSSISSPAFATVTTIGGGGGGMTNPVGPPTRNSVDGAAGGSGGGAGGQPAPSNPSSPRAGTAGLATGSPGQGVAGTQGFPGGLGSNGSPGQLMALGGGGGATAAGGNASIITPTATKIGGAGGAGYSWPFTANTYAGGGGGSGDNRCGPNLIGGLGGAGGGGPGGNFLLPGTPGTASTGGGGGGGSGGTPATNGGTGGSGVVILVMPSPSYPGIAPGAIVTTPAAAPGFTVLTYNTPSPVAPGSFTFTT